jgi:indolepyruvate ferredoxin oxidoreductase, alpha subunit
MAFSEEFKLPVILRPAIRVCHGRQNLSWGHLAPGKEKASFEKNPARWAATPKFRYLLHGELNQKLEKIRVRFETLAPVNTHTLTSGERYELGIVAGGVPHAVAKEILTEHGRDDIPLLKLGAPYPFPKDLAETFMSACNRVLVIEETDTVIEYFLRNSEKVLGRLSGHVPLEGELVPQVVERTINQVLCDLDLEPMAGPDPSVVTTLIDTLDLPIRKPTLCAGCPHRASFYAIRKAKPKAIYTSDIGCYTLGLNLGGVDTCLDMGAGITLASGFYHAFDQDHIEQPVIATMGDSTFFHSGTAGLINAVYNDARFILVILDNEITAMTGMQPSIASGIRANGSRGKAISLERIVAGCGIDFIETIDPYDVGAMTALIKRASKHLEGPDGGIAVIIARHPCLIANRAGAIPGSVSVTVTDDCDECGYCHDRFECPALYKDAEIGHTAVDPMLCSGCGVCLQVCPKGAIVESKGA